MRPWLSHPRRTVSNVRDLIVFDGDDTLWRVEHLYDDARERAAAIAADAGIDSDSWTQLQKNIDVANVATFGLSRFRFPHSSVLAYERAATELGITADNAIKERIRTAAATVFDATAPLMPGALDVIAQLAHTHRLVLLTQGDPVVQDKRIADSGLDASFEIVRIVERKTEASFSELLAQAQIAPQDAWSIGNSVPSDINPALRLGMSAIWIETHVWAHERREGAPIAGRLSMCDSLRQIPAIVAACSALVR